jgi:hypothetical protein
VVVDVEGLFVTGITSPSSTVAIPNSPKVEITILLSFPSSSSSFSSVTPVGLSASDAAAWPWLLDLMVMVHYLLYYYYYYYYYY